MGSDVPMFIGAMIVGPLAAWVIKKFDKFMENRVKAGFEMLVNNFSIGIIGAILTLLAVVVITPLVNVLNQAMSAGVGFFVNHGLLPLTSIFIEPAKVLFLNNALNHLSGRHRIEIRIAKRENDVRVSVFNTGQPIPEEDLPKLWTKFYKVDKARTREYGGSGIGLSIVKAIMDSHQKEYGVENREDGVEFWFTLDCSNT